MVTAGATRQRRLPLALSGLASTGIVVLLVGTFMPWLVSGRVNRNSYAATGALRTILELHGTVGVALRIWPFVSLIGAVAVALIVVGRAATGSALALVTAIVVGAVAVAALTNHSRGLVHAAGSGPAVTLAGSTLTLISGIAYFVQLFFASRRLA